MTSMPRLLLLLTLAFGVLAPAQAWAQDEGDTGRCFGTDTETAGGDDGASGGEVSTETGPVCAADDDGGDETTGGQDDDGGIGGVGRIDAGAGATAVADSASLLPWLLAAGAGVTGSVLRRRRRER